jgi:hypothetical protein
MTCCPLAFAGNEMGNGSDYLFPDDGAAWFLGETKAVSYCIDVASGFPVTANEIDPLIQSAVAQWKQYAVDKKAIRAPLLSKDPGKIAFQFTRQNCAASTDLTFYFGVENERIRTLKERYSRPIAFAARESYDATTGWGKGFVWFALEAAVSTSPRIPIWQDKTATLRPVLLHELGHIFGVPHIAGTIMDARLSQRIFGTMQSDYIWPEHRGKIDLEKELIYCAVCAGSTAAILGEGTGPSEDRTLFQLLFGRKAQGKISAHASWGTLGTGLTVQINDEVEARSWSVKIPMDRRSGVSFSSGREVFKRYLVDARASDENGGFAGVGLIEIRPSEFAQILITHNSDRESNRVGYLTMFLLQDAQILTFLRSKTQ